MASFRFNGVEIGGLATAIPSESLFVDSLKRTLTEKRLSHFKTFYGIEKVRKSSDKQTASDLGYVAARAIFERFTITLDEIGAIIFVSNTPDYRSPATACVLHNRLQLTKDCLAYDINIGGAGFIYGLQLGCSLLASLNKEHALIIIGDTTSKQISDSGHDSMIFGDAASAVLLSKNPAASPIYVKTKANGKGYKSLIFPGGAFRYGKDDSSNSETLQVNEQEICDFVIQNIPTLIKEFIKDNKTDLDTYDVIALQQSGTEVLKRVAEKLGLSFADIPLNYKEFGDTRGSSIPLILSDIIKSSSSDRELHVLACGFGEGFSSGIADFFISTEKIIPPIDSDESYAEGAVSRNF